MRDDLELELTQFVDLEQLVPQVDDDDHRDTEPMNVPTGVRAQTSSEWPPAPPLPAFVDIEPPLPDDVDLAQGTVDGAPPARRAGIFAAVHRPTTSSETTDD